MKTKVLFLLTALLATSFYVHAQRGVRIGYIDMEYILENVDEYQAANSQLDTKVQKWKGEIERYQSNIEQMRKNLSVEKVLLTKELIEEREEDIQVLEQEVLQYQQDRFGPKGDLVLQKIQLAKPIQDQVFSAVQDIASTKQYDFIFDKSADVVMLFSAKKYDISDLVLRRINVNAKKNKRSTTITSEKDKFADENDSALKGKSPRLPSDLDEEEGEPTAKQVITDKSAARLKLIEENRKRNLKEREAKKKEFEERRKKILAERAAAKKKREEDAKKKSGEIKDDEKEGNN
jgi:Skp family chaperone for outer membrane proteins